MNRISFAMVIRLSRFITIPPAAIEAAPSSARAELQARVAARARTGRIRILSHRILAQASKMIDEKSVFLHTRKSASAPGGGQSHVPRPNGSSSQQLKTSNSGWVQRATVAARFERWETRKNGKKAL